MYLLYKLIQILSCLFSVMETFKRRKENKAKKIRLNFTKNKEKLFF